jgi:hypothetical protein
MLVDVKKGGADAVGIAAASEVTRQNLPLINTDNTDRKNQEQNLTADRRG